MAGDRVARVRADLDKADRGAGVRRVGMADMIDRGAAITSGQSSPRNFANAALTARIVALSRRPICWPIRERGTVAALSIIT